MVTPPVIQEMGAAPVFLATKESTVIDLAQQDIMVLDAYRNVCAVRTLHVTQSQVNVNA